jgi:hypothetical protein
MIKPIIACLLATAFIASTTASSRAEPITLTVIAITSITAVALSAVTDMAVHNGDDNRVTLKNDDHGKTKVQAEEVKTIEQKANLITTFPGVAGRTP